MLNTKIVFFINYFLYFNTGHKWRAIVNQAIVENITVGINQGSPKPQDIASPSSCLG
jgi:hypothetical protein